MLNIYDITFKTEVKAIISIKGFEFTESQFNNILQNIGHLSQAFIEDNLIVVPDAVSSEEVFAQVDFSSVTNSKTLKDFKFENKGLDPKLIPVVN